MNGWAISKCPQTGRLELIDFDGFDLNKFSDVSLNGCIQAVDLGHPEKLRNLIAVKCHCFAVRFTVLT